MNADNILQAKARALIDAGHLPSTLPTRTWGGPGAGATCSVCSVAIGQHEIDIELELAAANASSATSHHFHVRCLAALEHALRQVKRPEPALTMATPAASGFRSEESQEGP